MALEESIPMSADDGITIEPVSACQDQADDPALFLGMGTMDELLACSQQIEPLVADPAFETHGYFGESNICPIDSSYGAFEANETLNSAAFGHYRPPALEVTDTSVSVTAVRLRDRSNAS